LSWEIDVSIYLRHEMSDTWIEFIILYQKGGLFNTFNSKDDVLFNLVIILVLFKEFSWNLVLKLTKGAIQFRKLIVKFLHIFVINA
jgi:hypothetical protein